MPAARPSPVLAKAEAAIRFFEERGREVVGVKVDGSKYHIEFAKSDDPATDPDLITMSK